MNKNKSTVTITSEGITTTVISKEGISIINEGLGEISFKLSNEKTPQDVRNQGELKEKCVNCELERKQLIHKIESKYLAELILHRMSEKGLPLSVLEESLVIIEEKFRESAILTI